MRSTHGAAPTAGRLAGLGAALLLTFTAACSSPDTGGQDGDIGPTKSGSTKSGTAVRKPVPGAAFDYQLGGPYTPPDQVRAVSRDRTADPVPGLYNICYVNAFQAQPGDAVTWWQDHHPDLLLLRADDGHLVIDEDWTEPLLDISTPARRDALMDIVGPWIDGCADAGYDAVEPDNLDSYERSDDLLDVADAVAFATLLADRAHEQGLAIAQKNTTDLLPHRARVGFDFAVVEECARYDECGDFADAYRGRVFDIEYVKADFATACRTWGEDLSITLRDLDVEPAGTKGHVYRRC
ncbi:endo alpha-1,4 polygalactosaminidase [Streptomyces sp. NPDC058001]|uniref:endo alpha-1,4 polygalactosaminidase n=1 Tax=Streptomyces sp. NPDC058001 TaxID=3346300 RepID=UPI0036E4DBEA